MDNTHRIVQVKGHYEAYDSNGNFVLSGDTWGECYNDLVDKPSVKIVMGKDEPENIDEVGLWLNVIDDDSNQ